MNINRLADMDAQLYVDSCKLKDVIDVRDVNLPGYSERFNKTFTKLRSKQYEPHQKKMVKLAASYRAPSSHTNRNIAVAAVIVVAAVVAHETGYDTRVKNRIMRWWNGKPENDLIVVPPPENEVQNDSV